ncbi:ABC transporter ATP-binding protein [Halonotius aquaticus]|uniref:ABC transporter ATP-binding protein n=1 Tax=Halonotius aquaticus TaxID=2216978 RepID=A0A3A6PPE0_9EURY|nr:ABC transporter ATP-binding protein [Halonotius aquaticus]RJX44088.1 ABC transporter ATP-binding protein [Halonotius aquaticus]
MSSIEPASDDDPFEEQRERVDDPMRRLVGEYGRPYWLSVLLGVLASLAARLLDLLPVILLGVAIDSLFQGVEPFSLPVVPQAWLPTKPIDQFTLVIVLITASFVVGAGFHWLRNWGFNSFAQDIQHDVRTDTYDTMQQLDMGFFADKQTGELMSILSNDVNQLERFLNDGLNSAFRLAVMVVAIAAYLVYLNPQLAVVALSPVPLIALFTYIFVTTIQPKYAAVRSSVGDVNSRLENNLGGIQVIKSSNTEAFESGRVDDVSRDYYETNWGAITIRIRFFPGLQLISGAGFILTFLVGGLWVFSGSGPGPFTGTLSTGEFVVFILFTQQLVWPMAQFGQIINMYQRAEASAERIFGLMDETDALEDDTGSDDLVVDDGQVAYDDVRFSYSEEPVLDDISFSVDGGDTLALVGPTGAGKSTVLKLLLRLYDPDSGAIRIDGQEIQSVSRTSLRQAIGYVGQESYLFYGTVRDNIAYGSFEATDAEIQAAAEAAEAHNFIQNLHDGYETMVGERGVKLSGGQRQRIAIARAILEDPDLLVLDEATSDVDTETEMLIQRSLDNLTTDRTTFAIAHRLSTIKDADQIVVLEDGRIVERGSHEELLRADGLYAHLWGVQAGEIDSLPQEFIDRAARRQARTETAEDD